MLDPNEYQIPENTNEESVGRTKVSAVYRLIFMLLAVLNQFLVLFGLYPIEAMDTDVAKLLSLGLCIVAGGVGYWKNNSWTPEAKAADKVMDSLKHQDVSITDVLEILADVSRKNCK